MTRRRWKDKGNQLFKLMKNIPNLVRETREENQLDQSMKNLLILTENRGEKPTDF